jgi:hypothetical protein
MLNNITNFFNLIAGKLIKKTADPTDLIALGTKNHRFGGGYRPTGITFSDLEAQIAAGVTPVPPTLQQVLDNNHDLVDGNNFQGTNAGAGNTGINVIAIGDGAGFTNSGDNVNAFGGQAANLNTGIKVNAFGAQAARNNSGNNVIAIGTDAGIGNSLSGMFIISNLGLPSYVDHVAAFNAISLTGIGGNTYIYHNQATNSIGAVRL